MWGFWGIFDYIFPFFFVIVFAIVLFVFVFAIGNSVRENRQNNASPRVNTHARVVSKRTNVSGGGQQNMAASTRYYVTFEFLSGDRVEFYVNGSEYSLLAEGDSGELYFQGSRFLNFDREYNR